MLQIYMGALVVIIPPRFTVRLGSASYLAKADSMSILVNLRFVWQLKVLIDNDCIMCVLRSTEQSNES